MYQSLTRFEVGPGYVWGDEAVPGGQQWIVGAGRFFGEDIQSGSIDFSGVKGIGKVLLVDERPASGVDKDGGGFHQ